MKRLNKFLVFALSSMAPLLSMSVIGCKEPTDVVRLYDTQITSDGTNGEAPKGRKLNIVNRDTGKGSYTQIPFDNERNSYIVDYRINNAALYKKMEAKYKKILTENGSDHVPYVYGFRGVIYNLDKYKPENSGIILLDTLSQEIILAPTGLNSDNYYYINLFAGTIEPHSGLTNYVFFYDGSRYFFFGGSYLHYAMLDLKQQKVVKNDMMAPQKDIGRAPTLSELHTWSEKVLAQI